MSLFHQNLKYLHKIATMTPTATFDAPLAASISRESKMKAGVKICCNTQKEKKHEASHPFDPLTKEE